VERGALVAWGSAGRGFRDASISKGWPDPDDVDVAIRPTPDGVGVKGGGLLGGLGL
jgi:hypothetical protein